MPVMGLTVALLINWICVSIVTLTFPIISSALGIQYTFALFAVCTFFGYKAIIMIRFFFIVFMVEETKDRSAKSIDHLYYLHESNQTILALGVKGSEKLHRSSDYQLVESNVFTKPNE